MSRWLISFHLYLRNSACTKKKIIIDKTLARKKWWPLAREAGQTWIKINIFKYMRKCNKNSNQSEPRAAAQRGRLPTWSVKWSKATEWQAPPDNISRVRHRFPPYLTGCPSDIWAWPWKVSLEEDAFRTQCSQDKLYNAPGLWAPLFQG